MVSITAFHAYFNPAGKMLSLRFTEM